MSRTKTIYDVFVSSSRRDAALSAEIARVLRSYGLSVYSGDEDSADSAEDVAWEAMSESQALVAVIPESGPSASSAVEFGAALAWNKPIYAVAANPATARPPVGLRGATIYPPARIDEIAREIKQSSDPLSEADLAILVEEYSQTGVPVDQLFLQPDRLTALTRRFRRRARRDVAAEELVRALLRLRKRGGLRLQATERRPRAV